MIEQIDFFTPARYGDEKTLKQHILEGIEGYFYLGGKSAYVIPEEPTIIAKKLN